jgi:hypothetical protein
MLSAQNGISVSGLLLDAGTVTFDVSWKNIGMPTPWSDTVWVWVDYNDAGVMKRLPVIAATASVGTVTKIADNDQGVWVIGDARTAGNFSTTVQLLTATATPAGACVYASNYPPVGTYETGNIVKFTGTPGYELYFSDGSTYTLSCESPCTYEVPDNVTLISFTDKTGAPGTFTQPSAPTDPTPDLSTAWRCGSGTVTLSASSAGAVIDWYDTDTGGTLLLSGSNTFTTPTLTKDTTYYAEARYKTTNQTSARVAVIATIKLYEGKIGGKEL